MGRRRLTCHRQTHDGGKHDVTRVAHLDYARLNIKMHVTTDIEKAYRIRACAKEPWTVAWIESMPAGSVLYDVGACVGSYALLAAALGHTVIAIEPSFANYARLCENVLLNELEGLVVPVCMALGGPGGSAPVMQQDLLPGASGGSKRLRVPMRALMDLPAMFGVPPPTHVKIDVDGGEVDVLKGGGTAASWLVEVDNANTEAVLALMGQPKQRWDTRPETPGLPPLNGWWYGLWER